MITLKQFRDAMAVVEGYCFQIQEKESPNVSTIGCRVKLSAWGLKAQGEDLIIGSSGWPISAKKNHQRTARLRKRIGKVIDYIPGAYPNQGLVIVKWDGIKVPDGMHESQIERA